MKDQELTGETQKFYGTKTPTSEGAAPDQGGRGGAKQSYWSPADLLGLMDLSGTKMTPLDEW